MRRFALTILVASSTLGCPQTAMDGPPPPEEDGGAGTAGYYHAQLAREAVPVDEGAHAGTFALKTVNTTLVHIPIADDAQGGGLNYRLVTRAWDGAAGHYTQSSVLCGGNNFEVNGVLTDVPQSTYRKVPESAAEVVELDADGRYRASGHLQLWGLRDLPDPFATPLPEDRDQATEAPHADRIYDMDEDGNPGITMLVTGLVSGEVYAIQRKTVNLDGIVEGPDLAYGLAENAWESLMLGNNNVLLDQSDQGSAEPWPDAAESWFVEIRLDDGATCEDVLALVGTSAFEQRPF